VTPASRAALGVAGGWGNAGMRGAVAWPSAAYPAKIWGSRG
jgi:hypothetical protein